MVVVMGCEYQSNNHGKNNYYGKDSTEPKTLAMVILVEAQGSGGSPGFKLLGRLLSELG